MGKGALDGIRIVDTTQFQSGTVCTMTLAWLGAEVIKIERPKVGELNRYSVVEPDIDSYSFITCNANKKSVTLNMKSPEGKEILWKLIEGADVFVENMSPGAIDRLGFGYDAVHERCPHIVYAQIKGFGLDGPWANYPAFDPIAQATGGSTSINGYPDGSPLQPGVDLADSGAGYMTVIAILAALYQRNRTGVGQRIEVAMQDTVIAFIRSIWEQQLRNNKPAPRVGNGMPLEDVAPANMYRCKPGGQDDYVHVYASRAPGSKQFELLMKKIGRPDILDDPRFATPQSRYLHKEELDEIITGWTMQKTKLEAMEELCKEGIPSGANLNTEDITNDPYLRKRGIITEIQHPQRGSVFMPAHPMMMEGTVPVTSSPLLGEHNAEILKGLLGFSDADLEQLEEKGVI